MIRLFSLIFFVLLTSCSVFEPDNCDDEMKKVTNRHGAPEEINKYSSDGYYNYDYWYWSKGIEYSFTWGKNVTGCKVSTYTFSPIFKFTD